jgi:hypothetical protein
MNSKPPVPETPLTPFIPLTLMMEHGAALNCEKIKTVRWMVTLSLNINIIFIIIVFGAFAQDELTVHFRFFNTNTCTLKSTRGLYEIILTGVGRRGYGPNRISTRRREPSNSFSASFYELSKRWYIRWE